MDKGTYVYCLVSAARRPSLARVPRGMPGAGPVRLLDVDRGLWLAVADVRLDHFSADAINAKLADLDWVAKAAVAHEAVVEAFIGPATVLPMKLFTIFGSDARAASHVAAERRRIDRALKRVAGRIELGVRVLLDRAAGKAALSVEQPARRGKAAVAASGADYLRRKKAQRDESSALAERAGAVAVGLYGRLEKRAALARRRPASDLSQDDASLLLDAAFLVPQTKVGAFTTAVAREARALAGQGYRVTLNGPWPAYSFIEE